MNYLSEEILSKMPLNRLQNIRRSILAQIHVKSGHYCCEGKCEWYENENYSQSEKDEDYAYRDLVNKYYNRQVDALVALVEMSRADVKAGRAIEANEYLRQRRAKRG